MSKHGLGRGLGSLFSIYEDNEPKKEEKKVKQDDTINQSKNVDSNTKIEDVTERVNTTQSQSTDTTSDVLQNARNLLNKINKTTDTAPQKPVQEIQINSNAEPVENMNFLKDKQALEEKFRKASNEGVLVDTGARTLPLSKIEPNPDQPRKNFNQDAIKELAQSIKLHGVIQPIVVTPRGDKYIIIAGERRYRASKLAGLQNVPVIIKNYTNQEMQEISLIENLQREDLNPIETAFAMKQLIDNYGFTQDDLAKRLGKSRPAITNALRLLNLSNEVMALVENGKLAPNSARALLSITDKEKQIELAKKACNDKMTTRELEKTVQEMLSPDANKKQSKITPTAEMTELKEFMQKLLGTKVTFLGTEKKGRIYIDYYSRDDLDRIYALLNKLR